MRIFLAISVTPFASFASQPRYFDQMIPDSKLIENTLTGNRAAFRQLVERYQDYVFSICLRVLGRREEAEEAAQDVFLKVHRMLHSYGEKSKFSTWLYTIAYRSAIDTARRRKAASVSLDTDENYIQVEDDSRDNPDEKMRRKDLSEQLAAAIERLKPEDATVITLFYLHEQSVAEVAEVTGLTVSNIKTKLHRLRETLRQQLALQLRSEIGDLL